MYHTNKNTIILNYFVILTFNVSHNKNYCFVAKPQPNINPPTPQQAYPYVSDIVINPKISNPNPTTNTIIFFSIILKVPNNAYKK